MQTIVVKNQSTVLTDAQVLAVLPALQIQLDRDLCPAWGLGQFHLEFRSKSAPISKGEQQFLFLDNTSDASALGYHDVTVNGDALSYVGVKATMDDGGQWTVTASHELCEMAVNPKLDDSESDDGGGRFYIKEVCDAVEDDSLGYTVAGVLVSDFVLPDWFTSDEKPSAPLSFGGHVTKAFELAPGGYISFVDLAESSKGWQQTFAKEASGNPGTKRAGTARGEMRARLKEMGGFRRKSTTH